VDHWILLIIILQADTKKCIRMRNMEGVNMTKKKSAYDRGWEQGFSEGMDADLSELYEAAEVLGKNYFKMLEKLVKQVDKKWKKMP